MANQILLNPHPYGVNDTQQWQELEGSIALAGSAVSTGEPVNWTDLISGVGYNEINFAGNGIHGQSSALVTTLSGDGTTVTATANNNFYAGEPIRFKGCTSAMGVKLNSLTVTVVTATSTQFTFLSALTDDGSNEVGLALFNRSVRPYLASNPPVLSGTVTALSASSTTLTVTAANTFMPGAYVIVNVATGTLGPKLAGLALPVIQSTGTAFTATMPTALTGTTGTGTLTGGNPVQPFSVRFWSALASGYEYQYSETFGTLFVMQSAGFTPAGTNSAPTITTGTNATVTAVIATNGGALTQATGAAGITGVQAPVFTGTAVAAGAFTKLAAAAYPAGVLADVIKFSARFIKS